MQALALLPNSASKTKRTNAEWKIINVIKKMSVEKIVMIGK